MVDVKVDVNLTKERQRMKTKHSPKPWTLEVTKDGTRFIRCKKYRIARILGGNPNFAPESERDHVVADEALMLSAPDMLKALKGAKKIEHRIEGCADKECPSCKENTGIMAAIKNAIIKAGGGK